MNELQVFNNSEFGEIRAVEIDGEPWSVGKDIAAALGYCDTGQALRKHVDDEDKLTRRFDGEPGSKGGNPNMTVTNESGVYSLIFSSKLPKAKEFKRWVTAEVLPSIRKHGAYIAPQAQPQGVEAAALQAVLLPFTSAMETLTAAVQTLTRRMDTMGQGRTELKALPPRRGSGKFHTRHFLPAAVDADDKRKAGSYVRKIQHAKQRYPSQNLQGHGGEI